MYPKISSEKWKITNWDVNKPGKQGKPTNNTIIDSTLSHGKFYTGQVYSIHEIIIKKLIYYYEV